MKELIKEKFKTIKNFASETNIAYAKIVAMLNHRANANDKDLGKFATALNVSLEEVKEKLYANLQK